MSEYFDVACIQTKIYKILLPSGPPALTNNGHPLAELAAYFVYQINPRSYAMNLYLVFQ